MQSNKKQPNQYLLFCAIFNFNIILLSAIILCRPDVETETGDENKTEQKQVT